MRREDRGTPGSAVVGAFGRPARVWRWLLAGVIAVAAPKCFLCLAGYVTVLTGVGWVGPELCGANPRQHGWVPVALGVTVAVAGLTSVLLVRVAGRRIRLRERS